MRLNYFEDANALTIIANELSTEPIIDNRRGYRALKPALKIVIPHYDLKDVLGSILDDYNAKELIEIIQEIDRDMHPVDKEIAYKQWFHE